MHVSSYLQGIEMFFSSPVAWSTMHPAPSPCTTGTVLHYPLGVIYKTRGCSCMQCIMHYKLTSPAPRSVSQQLRRSGVDSSVHCPSAHTPWRRLPQIAHAASDSKTTVTENNLSMVSQYTSIPHACAFMRENCGQTKTIKCTSQRRNERAYTATGACQKLCAQCMCESVS